MRSAAGIGTKRFPDALKSLQLLYLNGLVSPLFWGATSYQGYFQQVLNANYPTKPG